MILNFLKKLLPYRPIKVTSSFWEKRYIEGRWDLIRDIDELGHYSIVVGYTHFLKPGGNILDVGCGEGILCERLCKSHYANYLGIDLSTVAIERASSKNDEKNRFLVARVEEFRTDEKFDVIVFNECLYYMDDPVKTLQDYQSFLTSNGLFIVSMSNTLESVKIWRQISKSYSVIDAVSLSNAKRVCWTIKVLCSLD